MKIELNAKVKDTITDFEGIVTARAEYSSGRFQYLVTAQNLSNAGAVVEEWLDEARLKNQQVGIGSGF